MKERPPYYGIYSEMLLGLHQHCNERGCKGVMASTGYMRFDQNMPPVRSWAIEYHCPVCNIIAPIRERDKVPLTPVLG
jgi:hypothetical protein